VPRVPFLFLIGKGAISSDGRGRNFRLAEAPIPWRSWRHGGSSSFIASCEVARGPLAARVGVDADVVEAGKDEIVDCGLHEGRKARVAEHAVRGVIETGPRLAEPGVSPEREVGSARAMWRFAAPSTCPNARWAQPMRAWLRSSRKSAWVAARVDTARETTDSFATSSSRLVFSFN